MTLKSMLSANPLRFALVQTCDGLRSGSAFLGAERAADTPSWYLSFLFHTGQWAAFSFRQSSTLFYLHLHCFCGEAQRAQGGQRPAFHPLGFLMDKHIAPISVFQLTKSPHGLTKVTFWYTMVCSLKHTQDLLTFCLRSNKALSSPPTSKVFQNRTPAKRL